MRFCASWVVSLLVASAPILALAQNTVYWDRNDSAAGGNPGGPTFGDGIWSATDANWNPLADGTGTPAGWTAGDHAVFSAGSDISGDPLVDAQITITGTQVAASTLVEEGHVYILSGVLESPQITVNTGAKLSFNGASNFSTNASTITLAGGTLSNRNFGHAGSFIRGAQTLQIDGTGTITYEDTVPSTPTDCQCTIYIPTAGNAIKGVGGTPTAGTGTLIKTGAGEIRVQGAEVVNFSFEKLVVEQGLYRIGATGTPTTNTDRGFGATPAALLPDAITLNGGAIGVSLSTTISANRGITIGANGGTFFQSAAPLTINSPISGSGNITVSGSQLLTIGNADNVNFGGSLNIGSSGNVTMSQSMNVKQLLGTSTAGISVSSSRLLTAGDATDFTYESLIKGAGQFVKVGSGTMTIQGFQWTNTGVTNIDEGSLRLGNSAAGLSNGSRVDIVAGATWDMNNIDDTVDSLSGAGNVINGANLTLGRTSTTNVTFSGSYLGAGTMTKSGAGVFTLSGANNWTAVNFDAGRINFNHNDAAGPGTINVGAAAGIEFTNSLPGITLANNVALASSANPVTIYSTSGNSIVLSGVWSGDRALLRTDTGAGIWTFAGDNTFTGGLKMQSRSITLAHRNGLGTGTLTLGDDVVEPLNIINLRSSIAAGAGELTGANAIPNPVAVRRHFRLQGGNPIELSGNVTLGPLDTILGVPNTTRQIGSSGTGTIGILSGVISGSGVPIEKTDTATLVFSGANTYDGGTIVTAGTLLVNNASGSGTGSGAVAVNSGGTLGGTGSIAGVITVNSGGHVAPGASIGTLTAAGGVTLETGSILDFELGAPGTSDLLDVSASALTINGVGAVNLTNPGGGLAAGIYTLIDYGTVAGAGLASFLSQAPTGPAGFSYSLTDTGSLINLSVVVAPTNDADFNGDGVIDQADYIVWRKFNPIAAPDATQGTGDANGDTATDGADYDEWVKQFGNPSPGSGEGGSGAVPEPATLSLLILGASAAGLRRRPRALGATA